MSEAEHLIRVVQMLEAGTWVSRFVKSLASASFKKGHRQFATDPIEFQHIAEDAVEGFRFDLEYALNLVVMYPDLFKDPIKTKLAMDDDQ